MICFGYIMCIYGGIWEHWEILYLLVWGVSFVSIQLDGSSHSSRSKVLETESWWCPLPRLLLVGRSFISIRNDFTV